MALSCGDLPVSTPEMANSPSVTGSPFSSGSSPQLGPHFILDSTVPGLGEIDLDQNVLQGIAIDADVAHLAATKAGEWLQANFHSKPDASLPRNLLHHHYLHYCRTQNVTPVNGATLSKVVKGLFPDMKIRRLGTRGHSRHHYSGVAPREGTGLMQDYLDYDSERVRRKSGLVVIGQENATPSVPTANQMADQAARGAKTGLGSPYTIDQPGDSILKQKLPSANETASQAQSTVPRTRASVEAEKGRIAVQYPRRDWSMLPGGVSAEQANQLLDRYERHLNDVMELVYATMFAEIGEAWKTFWQHQPPGTDIVLRCEPVVDLLCLWDDIFYNATVQVLLPSVTHPLHPSLAMAVREYAKQIEGWARQALSSCPALLQARMEEGSRAYAFTLRGQTSLNHLAQAARAALQTESVLNQMVSDWSRLDFGEVEDQARWTLDDANMALLKSLYTGLSELLEEGPLLEDYTDWLDGIVEDYLTNKNDLSLALEEMSQFTLQWSFLTSLIIRDLTLRSATSFGHFHLLRLLLDEYALHLVDDCKRRLMTQRLTNKALGDTGPPPSNANVNVGSPSPVP